MALNLGQVPKVEGIKGVIGGHTTIGPSSYRSAESAEQETHKFLVLTNVLQTIHTVTTGKTYFITSILVANNSAAAAALAEIEDDGTNFMEVVVPIEESFWMNMTIPMKFDSGSVIKAKTDNTTNGNVFLTLIGWEE